MAVVTTWMAQQLMNEVIRFATGFRLPHLVKTPRGHVLQTELFKVVFEGITEDGEISDLSRILEHCLDWTGVIKKLLGACEVSSCLEDIEDMCKEEVTDWLATYDGFGLLMHLCTNAPFMLAVVSTYVECGRRTRRKVFNAAKTVFELIEGESLASVVPLVEVWFEEDVELEERSKWIVIEFKGCRTMAASFIVEKKSQVNGTLREFASEAVARCLQDEDDLLELEVPLTLRSEVRDKYRDEKWVRGHWDWDETVYNGEEEEEGQFEDIDEEE